VLRGKRENKKKGGSPGKSSVICGLAGGSRRPRFL
jgi:hypothetical protein